MEYLKDGTFDTKFLVTHRVKLEDFPELYNAFDKRYAGKSLRLLLDVNEGTKFS
jgi:threonine dehydrogenase-like Zn-dependent dehydrogenase